MNNRLHFVCLAAFLVAAPAAAQETACYIAYSFTPASEGAYTLRFAMVEAPIPASRSELSMLAGLGRGRGRDEDAFPLGVVTDRAAAVRQVRERLVQEAPGPVPLGNGSMSGNCSEASLTRRGQIATGVVVRGGRPLPQPRTTADTVALIRRWAEGGSAMAQADLGTRYDRGWGVPQDDTQALRWFRAAATAGVPEAQMAVGNMLFRGRGTAANATEALTWYRRAAEAGYGDAEMLLGLFAETGTGGMGQSDAEAARWYRLASEHGKVEAIRILGQMTASGRGVARNDAQALQLLRRAVAAGDAEAMWSLAGMYSQGRGVPADVAQAVALMRRSAAGGYGEAQYNLAIALMQGGPVPQDIPAGMAMLRRAAEGGHARSQGQLGTQHFLGEYTPESLAEAIRWWRLGAERGDAAAQSNLGQMLATGRGVARDDVEAAKWLDLGRAELASDPEGQAVDAALRARLTATQRAEVQRRVAAWRPSSAPSSASGSAAPAEPSPPVATSTRPGESPAGGGSTPAPTGRPTQVPAAVTRLLAAVAERAAQQGYRSTGAAPLLGALNDDRQEDLPLRLEAGRQYLIVGVCDADCSDMDFRLLDPRGAVAAEDMATDDNPVVRVTPGAAGEYRLRVIMPACSANPCFYGVSLFAK